MDRTTILAAMAFPILTVAFVVAVIILAISALWPEKKG